MRLAIRPTVMPRSPFTLEIDPRAWYALANLPKEAYERVKRGLAGVAENAPHARSPELAAGLLSLDGYLARFEVQPERRCVRVLDIERRAAGGEPRAAQRNVLIGSAAEPSLSPAAPPPTAPLPGKAEPGDC